MNYRDYFSWQESMKLGLTLYRLADELPNEEQHLLASDLRRAAVEVPAGIAQNIVQGKPAEMYPMIKLQTVMELIAKVYPALDTADAEREVNALAERLSDKTRFMEVVPSPVVPVAEAEDEEEDEEADEDDDDDYDEADGQSEVHIGVQG